MAVPFIRVWYDTNGIIAGWARVEPDQCKMIITGWSSQNVTTAFEQQHRMMGSLVCLWVKFLLLHILNAKLHRKPERLIQLKSTYTLPPPYLSFKAAMLTAFQYTLHMSTANRPEELLKKMSSGCNTSMNIVWGSARLRWMGWDILIGGTDTALVKKL